MIARIGFILHGKTHDNGVHQGLLNLGDVLFNHSTLFFRCTPRTLTVILLDQNDHRPIVTSSKRSFTISEDAPIGTVLTTIHAEDKDALNPPALYKNQVKTFPLEAYFRG